MDSSLQALQNAVQTLYTSPNRRDQNRADTWLQDFRQGSQSWRLCLAMLASSSFSDTTGTVYFAANNLRYHCGKNQDLVAGDVLPQVLSQLSRCLLSAVECSNWPVTSQLCSALSVLILRSPTWEPGLIILELEALLMSQLLHFNQHEQQRDIALISMLHLLVALPPTCTDKNALVHPNRRLAVSEALSESPHVQPWTQAAMGAVAMLPEGPMRSLYLGLGLKLIHGWCELGTLPLCLPQQESIVQQVCIAATQPEFATLAAETLVSMLTICKDPVAYGSDALPSVVAHWQAAWAPLQQQLQHAKRQQQAQAQATGGPQGSAPHSGGGEGDDEDADLDGVPQEVLQAGCSVNCAAGAALLPLALTGGGSSYHAQFVSIAEQLLQQLTSKDMDVALTALEFWQDTYVATLQGLPSDARQAALASHTGLLQHLTTSLVVRAHLGPDVASTATADARDLPEDVRMVRRELSSALRDISSLVGAHDMTSYMANIVQAALAQYTSSAMSMGHTAWAHLECTLYAANVVLGHCGVGKTGEGADPAAVSALVDVAIACAAYHRGGGEAASNTKLAGTALTILGGLAQWYLKHPDVLSSVLTVLTSVLQSPDQKLSRNGATTVYRLCQHSGLANHLLAAHRSWVDSLLQLYQARGGVQQRIGHGDDLSTEELLLASLCRLAVLPAAATAKTCPSSPLGSAAGPRSTSSGNGSNLLVMLATPKLHELQQALTSLVACAPTTLAMLGGSPTFMGSSPPPMAAAAAAAASTQQQAFNDPMVVVSAVETTHAAALAVQAGSCLEVLQMITENATAQLSGKGSERARRAAAANAGSSTASTQHSSSTPSPQLSLASPAVGTVTSWAPASPLQLPYGGSGNLSGHLSWGGLQSPGGDGRGLCCQQQQQQQQQQQAAAAAAVHEQALELVQAVWQVLQPVLLDLQGVPAVFAPACSFFLCSLQTFGVSSRHNVLVWAATLLASTPQATLAIPQAMALLAACLDVFRAPAVPAPPPAPPPSPPPPTPSFSPSFSFPSHMRNTTGSWDGVCSSPSGPVQPPSRSGSLHAFSFNGGAGLSRFVEPPSPSASSQPALPAGMEQHLLAVTQLTLMAGTERALNSMDSELLTPLLRLCCAAIQHMPDVLAMPSTLDTLLTMTQATACCSDMEQCREWLKWITLLCSAPFCASPSSSQPPSGPNSSATATAVANALLSSPQQAANTGTRSGKGGVAFADPNPVPSTRTALPPGPAPASEGLAQLAARLDANAGPQLVLSLLMAASGDMPADLILPIATSLHEIWGAVGTNRLARWLEVALLVLSPPHAPWAKLKLETKSAFLQELLSQEMETDITRFKRHVKSFCGGKKKQARFDTLMTTVGSRQHSRSPSRNAM